MSQRLAQPVDDLKWLNRTTNHHKVAKQQSQKFETSKETSKSLEGDLEKNVAYLFDGAVPDDNLVTGVEEVLHHSGAHDAQSEEAKLER